MKKLNIAGILAATGVFAGLCYANMNSTKEETNNKKESVSPQLQMFVEKSCKEFKHVFNQQEIQDIDIFIGTYKKCKSSNNLTKEEAINAFNAIKSYYKKDKEQSFYHEKNGIIYKGGLKMVYEPFNETGNDFIHAFQKRDLKIYDRETLKKLGIKSQLIIDHKTPIVVVTKPEDKILSDIALTVSNFMRDEANVKDHELHMNVFTQLESMYLNDDLMEGITFGEIYYNLFGINRFKDALFVDYKLINDRMIVYTASFENGKTEKIRLVKDENMLNLLTADEKDAILIKKEHFDLIYDNKIKTKNLSQTFQITQ